jgi:hypothetical protein
MASANMALKQNVDIIPDNYKKAKIDNTGKNHIQKRSILQWVLHAFLLL